MAAAAKLHQSCPTLCDRIESSPPGSPIPGILQARILEWVAISFSNAWKGKGKMKLLSCVRLFVTPWTAAFQSPPTMEFSRPEYWSGVTVPSPRRVHWGGSKFLPKNLNIFMKNNVHLRTRKYWSQNTLIKCSQGSKVYRCMACLGGRNSPTGKWQ